MKNFKTLMMFLLLVITLTGCKQNVNWKEYSSKNGFKAEFPQEPKEGEKVADSAIGELKMQYLTCASDKELNLADNINYMIAYTEYPEEQIHSEMTEILDDFFRGSIDEVLNNINGSLISEEKINIRDFPGREIKISYYDENIGQDCVVNVRLFLVRNKYYIVQTLTEASKENNKSIARFMDSFKIIK